MHVNNTIPIKRASNSINSTNYVKFGELFLDQAIENTISDFNIEDNLLLEQQLVYTIATIKENNGKLEVNVKAFEGHTHSVDAICVRLAIQLKSYLEKEEIFISKN